MTKKNIAVIGSGPMGLMCAYRLLQQGNHVDIFEADDRIGGMTASFDFNGTQIERFYHFVCASDTPTFDLLKEFNLHHKLKWRDTYMGFYYHGKLYQWGTPMSLLKFPKLSFIDKYKYARFVMKTIKVKDWAELDTVPATDWLKKNLGGRAYDVLWKPLFHYKFYQYANDLSAAWLGTRIKRVGVSRRNIWQESLGYIEGGSKTLLDAMQQHIEKLGGLIHCSTPVTQVLSHNQQVTGVQTPQQKHTFDQVISTIPLPFVSKLATGLSAQTKQQIDVIKNVAVVCVLFKLKKPFSRYFWININDPTIEIPGLIEYTNLNPSDESIVYAPYYLPHDHEKHAWADQQFLDEAIKALIKINPKFNQQDILDTKVTRYPFAQTVCTPNFYSQLPPMRSEIKGFYMADTSHYYPEDRSIAESVALGEKLASYVS